MSIDIKTFIRSSHNGDIQDGYVVFLLGKTAPDKVFTTEKDALLEVMRLLVNFGGFPIVALLKNYLKFEDEPLPF